MIKLIKNLISTYIYMHIIIHFDIKICIPQCNCGCKVCLCFGRQFKVTLDMFLFPEYQQVQEKTSYWVFCLNNDVLTASIIFFASHSKQKGPTNDITSLKKSPCLLSSASIALSRIPPDVALAAEGQAKWKELDDCHQNSLMIWEINKHHGICNKKISLLIREG